MYDDDLTSAYQDMAADAAREREAILWSNALIGDVSDVENVEGAIAEEDPTDQIS